MSQQVSKPGPKPVSELRIEKRQVPAELTLTNGAIVNGCFFLASSSAIHAGPERVGDLLNAETGFFPFRLGDPGVEESDIALYNRTHLILVRLVEPPLEAKLDSGYDVAIEKQMRMLLTNGGTVTGSVRVYRPVGRDRLSDYAGTAQTFRYVEAADGTYIVNGAHVIELRDI